MANTTFTSNSAKTFDAAALERLVTGRRDPDWVTQKRYSAFQTFQQLSNGPLDPEEWKRVELRTFQPHQFRLVERLDGSVDAVSTLLRERTTLAGEVAHVDGHCVTVSLRDDLAQQGVILQDLTRLVQSHGDLVQRYLGQGVAANRDRFAAWHSAFWTSGTVLYIPPGTSVSEPFHSLIVLHQDGAADFSHTLVVLGEGASATLLEETVSTHPDRPGLHVGAVELFLAPGANLRYVQLQNWNQKTWHFAHQVGRVSRDARLQWTLGGLGAKTAHIHQDVELLEPGAEAEVNGVALASDRQTLSFYTQQNHRARQTRSDLLYKDVLQERSRVVWRGMIKVAPGAQRTDGYQRNDALLLSDAARVDAIPGLEIETDDVRCTHGTTVSRVDEEQLLYCMCRGLTRQEAMRMIVSGFMQVVVDRIPLDQLRDALGEAMERKLGLSNPADVDSRQRAEQST